MKRLLGYLSLATLAATIVWLGLLIYSQWTVGPQTNFQDVLTAARQNRLQNQLVYLNATLVTLAATMLFAALHIRYSAAASQLGRIAFSFTPVYCTLNLMVYTLQLSVVPNLLDAGDPVSERLLETLLLQAWPGSAIAFINGLAYAVLGIPSILYGRLMMREGSLLGLAGLLLALNGIACMLGVAGFVVGSSLLGLGTVIGGVFFLLALIPMGIVFIRL